MIVIDANIWIDHIRHANPHLGDLLKADRANIHPYTIGEVGLGSLARRSEVIEQLGQIPGTPIAEHQEVMAFIGLNGLAGTGVGYVDCHLLTTALLQGGSVWTNDKRLAAHARRLAIEYTPEKS